jgi:hypothetical protein
LGDEKVAPPGLARQGYSDRVMANPVYLRRAHIRTGTVTRRGTRTG